MECGKWNDGITHIISGWQYDAEGIWQKRLVKSSGDSTGGIAVNRLFCGPSPGVTGARWKGKWTSGYKRPQSQQRWKAEGALVGREFLFSIIIFISTA